MTTLSSSTLLHRSLKAARLPRFAPQPLDRDHDAGLLVSDRVAELQIHSRLPFNLAGAQTIGSIFAMIQIDVCMYESHNASKNETRHFQPSSLRNSLRRGGRARLSNRRRLRSVVNR